MYVVVGVRCGGVSMCILLCAARIVCNGCATHTYIHTPFYTPRVLWWGCGAPALVSGVVHLGVLQSAVHAVLLIRAAAAEGRGAAVPVWCHVDTWVMGDTRVHHMHECVCVGRY